ncbi:gamma-glutamylcyclotransferase family protein [Niabella ginsengisoli]|uniref:Gamma-glutamylcyclotransferase n=1 Tax=Niabella ginsengisoli TaxID=522298 RepID=A0ABS9SPQ3_9BACT|nr:gamma-glutamylcyclotransferase family protein [Niabella ginsengisoli]MCH5600345.1 gamma-glutamylcyclotransferase [Niabella ginsengisoli]
MQTHSHFLFVYGSLLSGFKSPAYEYISKYFKLKGEALVKGTIYDMGTFPVGTPVDTGRFIKGELYEIKNPKELSFILAQLDDYEGLYPDDGEDIYYKRDLVETNLESGENIIAWIYWYNKDVEGKPIVESDNMMDYLAGKQEN